MKKSAVAIPTSLRRRSEISARPRAISTMPDAITTKSGESGSQVGTCAWNEMRLVVKCAVPVKMRAAPKSFCVALRIKTRFLRVIKSVS